MQAIKAPSSGSWDRTLLRMSSTLAEPICETYRLFRYRLFAPLTPNTFDNCTTLTKEIGFRTLLGLSGVCGVYLFAALPIPMTCGIAVLGGGSKLLRAIGFSLQKDGFTHVQGNAPEETLQGSLKIMTWNVCGIGGGFHYDHGGVIDWRSRFKGIAEKIENENPDVLILQEIYDTALGEALIERLKDRYAHFFMHLGKSVMGSVGGCMVISKCGVHSFSNTEFTTNDWTLKRGYAVLEVKASPKDELPAARVIGTHLIHYDDERGRSTRVKQIAQIVDHIARQRLSLPTLLAGDLNIERDKEEGEILLPYLRHGYTHSENTASNKLVWQWDQKKRGTFGETIDYISLFKERLSLPVIENGIEFKDCHLSPAFDENYDTRTALSDHHAIVATIHLGKNKIHSNLETEIHLPEKLASEELKQNGFDSATPNEVADLKTLDSDKIELSSDESNRNSDRIPNLEKNDSAADQTDLITNDSTSTNESDNSAKMGSPRHVALSACETQDSEMQGRNRAHSQSAMGEGDDAADRCPPQEGASTTCLGLPKNERYSSLNY